MKERNKGLDLLRIMSMYMVVILHILSQGSGLLTKLTPGSIAWNFAWLLEIACYCAVNCFILITGYLMIDRLVKVSNIVTLWFQVAFYSIGITIIYLILDREMLNETVFIKSFFPVIGQQYWYFTAYFAMFLLLPFINLLLGQLNKWQYTMFLAILVGLFSIVNTLSLDDCFKIENGYSVIWMIAVYAIGGYIKRFDIFTKKPMRLFVGYLIAILLTWIIKVFSITVPIIRLEGTIINSAFAVLSSALITYSAPTILCASICLFGIFKQIQGRTSKFILWISKMSFAVYLIHTHPLIFYNTLPDAFAFVFNMPWWGQTLMVLLVAASIFIICLFIESFRQLLFRLCRIEKLSKFVDTWIGNFRSYIQTRINASNKDDIE